MQSVFILICYCIISHRIQLEAASSPILTRPNLRNSGSPRASISGANGQSTPPVSRASSISSFTSQASTSRLDTSPKVVATSSKKAVFAENAREPLLKTTRQRQIINLDEAFEQTNGVNINPTRDGVYARVKKILLQSGAALTIGAGIGAGSILFEEHFNHNNNKTYYNNKNNTEALLSKDDISNPV